MSDHSALHQVDQKWSDASFHDMSAEHDDDSAIAPRGEDDGRNHCAKIRSDENVG